MLIGMLSFEEKFLPAIVIDTEGYFSRAFHQHFYPMDDGSLLQKRKWRTQKIDRTGKGLLDTRIWSI